MVSSDHSSEGGAVALYHVIYASEDLRKGAKDVLSIIAKAQRAHPGKPRKLFLDIDGRRHPGGELTAPAQMFVQEMVVGFLGKFVTEVSVCGRVFKASPAQVNDVPGCLPP